MIQYTMTATDGRRRRIYTTARIERDDPRLLRCLFERMVHELLRHTHYDATLTWQVHNRILDWTGVL